MAASVFTVATSPPAVAAAGPAFTCNPGKVFLAQGTPTQLESVVDGPGSATFLPIGTATNGNYNALGYNPGDNYLYAVASTGHLLKIDSTGTASDLGATAGLGVVPNAGTFDPAANFYVTLNGLGGMYKVNISTNTATAIPYIPTATPDLSDFTYDNGFIWGLDAITGNGVRIDPATGAITTFPQTAVPAGNYGALWTYGNGNIGMSNNGSGEIYEVQINNSTSATPSYTLVKSEAGPGSSNNDGASCAGPPADLQLAKSGPPAAAFGTTITWTLTVTNNGRGDSSGFAISDPIPAGVTNAATTTSGCRIGGTPSVVTCSEGPLANGSTFPITITGTAPSVTGNLTNTATVTGNEADPVPANNSSSATTSVAMTVGGPLVSPTGAAGAISLFAIASLIALLLRRRPSK